MKCKHCKEKFVPKAFLQKYCMEKDECVSIFLAELREKNKKQNQKNERAEVKQLAEQWKRHGDWLKDLENVINKIARLIDAGYNCISCGHAGKPQAGHYHSVGSDAGLRYNLHNIHIQCYQCNAPKGGNIIGYDEGLIHFYGSEYWNYVKFNLKNIYHQPLKVSIPQIKESIEICRGIIKELEKGEQIIGGLARIQMRSALNERIGIYPQNIC